MKNKIKLPLIALFSAVLFMCADINAQTVSGGKCGENVEWSFDGDNGVLTLTGSGDMYDYGYSLNGTFNAPPWDGLPRTEVIVGDGITSVGNYAFCDMNGSGGSIRVELPGSIKRIGICSFADTDFESFEIPEGTELIDIAAFTYCNIGEITFPKSVKRAESQAFSNSRVKRVNAEDLAAWCEIEFADMPATPLCNEFSAKPQNEFYVNGERLTTLTIPDGIGKINDYSFYGCSGLEELVLPEDVKQVGKHSFEYCAGLKKITFGGATEIGDFAFSGCESLTGISVPDGTPSIGESAFENCAGCDELTIPEGVKHIGKNAFSNNGNLTKLRILQGVETIGENAFGDCPKLAEIVIPDGVCEIGAEAFRNCAGNAKVTFSGGCEKVGKNAFYNEAYSAEYAGVYINDLAAWCGTEFENETANPLAYCGKLYLNGELLTELEVPAEVKSVGSYAFFCGENIERISLHDNIEHIGRYAFYDTGFYLNRENWGFTDASGEKTMNEFLYIGDYLIATEIGRIRPEVLLPGGEGAWSENDKFGFEFKDGVKLIAGSAFENCANLTRITLPESVKHIGEYAFANCASLESITLSDNIKEIGDCTFYYCTGLTEIKIPDGVCEIGNNAFENCSRLSEIILPAGLKKIGNGAFLDCDGLTEIKIPDGVCEIGDETFKQCHALKKVTLSGKIEKIGVYAFDDCRELTDITIPPEGVRSIGHYAFNACERLEKITLPETLETIGAYAFGNCSALTEISIPKNVGKIYTGAFCDCGNLKTVALSGKPEKIEDNTFKNCTSLENVTIPEGVKTIGVWAFYGCSALKHIVLPEGTEHISEGAFEDCGSLVSAVLPKSVTFIENMTFGGFNESNLSTVYYAGSESDWNKIYIGYGCAPGYAEVVYDFKGTKTYCTDGGKAFHIRSRGIEKGGEVLLALYDGKKLTDVLHTPFDGAMITFATDKAYDTAKVIVWKNLESTEPV